MYFFFFFQFLSLSLSRFLFIPFSSQSLSPTCFQHPHSPDGLSYSLFQRLPIPPTACTSVKLFIVPFFIKGYQSCLFYPSPQFFNISLSLSLSLSLSFSLSPRIPHRPASSI
uniref:Secreted protein n=1 Tax=Cacopsylla melanoneura TaxID=428564 RepID=A0A8D8ZGA4_9HEMI